MAKEVSPADEYPKESETSRPSPRRYPTLAFVRRDDPGSPSPVTCCKPGATSTSRVQEPGRDSQ